jgi:hypothetical protein
MKQSFKDMATRHDNAIISFVSCVVRDIDCTEADARAILGLYLEHKIATVDHLGGGVRVKHGAYLEPNSLENALQMVRETAAA